MKCKPNQRSKNGKCVSKQSSISKKKSYNPFKMWGSYVGAVVGFIIVFIDGRDSDIFSWLIDEFLLPLTSDLFISIPMGLIIGFLIGYAIHSLFRKFKK